MAVRRPSASLGAALLAALALTTAATASVDDASAVTDIVLTVGADETQRNVAWYTPHEVTGSVQWAPASAVEGDEFPAANADEAETTSNGETHDGRHFHHATMDGLEDSTDYVYRVGGGEWSTTYRFSTGDFDSREVEFLVVGDPQMGSSGDVAADQQGWNATLDTALEMFPDAAWVHSMGDQVEEPSNEAEYRALLDPDALRSVPFAFNLGNHDAGSTAYATHFHLPGAEGAAGYHWYRHGDVLVIGLDSNALDVEAHDAFIENVLAEQAESAAWHIVTFHHPAFGLAEHSNTAEMVEFREAISPVLSEHGIDLVLNGHAHTYARSTLMDAREPVESEDPGALHPDEGQTLYLTLNSSSGSKYYPLATEDFINAADPQGFDFAQVTWQEEAPNFTHVEVSADVMTIGTYRTDTGEAYDEVVLHRAGAPEPSPPASPSASPSSSAPSPSPRSEARPDAAAAEGDGMPAGAIAAIAVGALALAGGGTALWRRQTGGPH
ncbi:purple acid phosphatase family protein [Demequina aestuarii]|uniref:purple acid phosphatase family protein n=1 Tax=Demequina aestuarii TaxID=327095 RepID=UPI000A92673B|nr:metallophosphoesterase family protein [Demequina aestuarii]